MRKFYHLLPKPTYIPTRQERLEDRANMQVQKTFFIGYIVFFTLLVIFLYVAKAHADTCKALSCGSIPQKAIVANKEVIWTQEMEDRHLAELMKVKQVKKVPKRLEKLIQAKVSFDIYKLANAVAMAETGGCKTGYGASHNNCHWIKHGNTVRCPGVPKGKMCKFKTKQESYEAFVTIWAKWYKTMPNLKIAKAWTGDDKKVSWLYNVNHHYNK